MEAKTSLSSTVLPTLPNSFSKSECKSVRFLHGKRSSARVLAARRDAYEPDYNRGCLVDESMIILRKRIHEMKVIQRNYEPPEEWMEWEKQYYTCYDEYICTVVGLLQSQLMNTRPSLALGMLALIMLSVPASTFMIVLRLMEVANGVFSTINLG
ncbi:Mediator of RNA polymerase II transcription subunit [Fagus crenata]